MIDLRSWLRKEPQAAQARVGATIVAIGSSRWKWREAEDAILAADGDRVEALDKDGRVLRAIDLERVRDEQPEERGRLVNGAWPDSEIGQLAMVLSRSNDEATTRVTQAWSQAFDRLVALTQGIADRLHATEEAREREARLRIQLLEEIAQARAVSPETGAGWVDQAMGTMIAGAMGAPVGASPRTSQPTDGRRSSQKD